MKNLDIESAINWNKSYILKEQPDLWGEQPVPYVHEFIRLFANNHLNEHALFLDLPCGDGRNMIPLCNSLPFVIGGDYSENALKITELKLNALQCSNYKLCQTDIFSTKDPDDYFEGIFCWDILGHLVDIKGAIKELLRILKPGGLLMGSVFSTDDSTLNDPKMKQIGDNEHIYDDRFYFKYYKLETVKQMLSGLNVNVLSIELANWREGPHEGYREYEHDHQSWVFVIKK